MPMIYSKKITKQIFLNFLEYLLEKYQADVFFKNKNNPQQYTCFIGINPNEELLIQSQTTKTEIKKFCFKNKSPTLGFLSYNYGLILKKIPSKKKNKFPYGYLKKYQTYLFYSFFLEELKIFSSDTDFLKKIEKWLNLTNTVIKQNNESPCINKINQSISEKEYLKKVEQILKFIKQGYTYQLNLSIKFLKKIINFNFNKTFFSLLNKYPSPFFLLYKINNYDILSTSPEKFLQVSQGKILSQPIKGTLAFNKFSSDLIKKLQNNPKESAELSMIVDLIRNDISYHAEYNSVQVKNHKSVFQVDNLLQMYSDIQGILKEKSDCLDLLFDAFPGGSVTGCPKKKSMEIIELLEPHNRDIYCGSIFLLEDEKNMDSCIAIRTAYFNKKEKIFNFFAGSGIVVDSIPQKEYLETKAKAKKFLEI